jgi:hypothetical protein
MPAFEVWTSPGGKVWAGSDQEEALLTGIRHRHVGVLIEVAEIYDMLGQIRPRRIASFDDRLAAETSQ